MLCQKLLGRRPFEKSDDRSDDFGAYFDRCGNSDCPALGIRVNLLHHGRFVEVHDVELTLLMACLNPSLPAKSVDTRAGKLAARQFPRASVSRIAS